MAMALKTAWEYEEAVKELKPMVTSWKKKTIDIVRLLYKANNELSASGKRTDLDKMYRCTVTTSGQMSRGSNPSDGETLLPTVTTSGKSARGSEEQTPQTWEQFCEDVGLGKRTANRWLALYDAKEDRLLEADEAKARAIEITNLVFEEVREHRYNGEPDWKPAKWNDRLETQYEIWLTEKGYVKPFTPTIAAPSAPEYPYGQYGLFNSDYLASLQKRVIERTTGDQAIRFTNIVDKYAPRVPKGINAGDVARISELAVTALESFPKEQRVELSILCAEMLRDQAVEEFR